MTIEIIVFLGIILWISISGRHDKIPMLVLVLLTFYLVYGFTPHRQRLQRIEKYLCEQSVADYAAGSKASLVLSCNE